MIRYINDTDSTTGGIVQQHIRYLI